MGAEAVSLWTTNGTFRIAMEWADGQTVKVQACRDLSAPVWQDVGTYPIVDGAAVAVDTNWLNAAEGMYRFVAP